MILDMALPGREGFRVLQELRAAGRRLPVIMLNGRPELRDAFQSMDDGADDYMIKLFRSTSCWPCAGPLRTPRLSTPPYRRSTPCGSICSLDGRQSPDGPSTSRPGSSGCRNSSMRHPDQVLSAMGTRSPRRDTAEPGTNVINVYVAMLRKKLGVDVIDSVRGVGYCMPSHGRRATATPDR